jgi:hypothetical protein
MSTHKLLEGPGWLNELGRCRVRVAQWVRSLDLTVHTSLSPIRRGFAPSFVNYKKGCHMSWSFSCSIIGGERWLLDLVEINGIVDHHCLNFIFIISNKKQFYILYLVSNITHTVLKYLVRTNHQTLWTLIPMHMY